MASIILSAAGGALGGGLLGPVGRMVGGRLGSLVGGFVDNSLFGQKRSSTTSLQISELAVQTSTYGKMVPIVYGTVRIAGNMIWSRPIIETVTTTSNTVQGGKGGGGRVTQTQTTYSYSVSVAIAICEGPVDHILRVWADSALLDLSRYTTRLYLGTEEQMADALMVATNGADATPAYRGLAYIVFEDFPLGAFGNRIPNFTFEVRRKLQRPDYGDATVEEMVQGITLIPGAGEFVYDTQAQYKVPGEEAGAGWAQNGHQNALNVYTPTGTADVMASLDQLADTCPNVSWVSVVVNWFGDSLDAGECKVLPGVEYQSGAITQPAAWSVAGFDRDNARQITLVDNSPRYGGTPDDASVLRLLDELKERGYSIMFYPMLFMDVDGKPWRGHLTGSAGDVADFFTKTNGFNAFITHYANLVEGKVDAFVIGSELKGLTSVTGTPGHYPAVNALISLAGTVKTILGDVTVTYAADWSEYHHDENGWYNLDPLWACDDIDVIGIDAYFPLTTGAQDGAYDVQNVIEAWDAGEGYDYYHTDPERTATAPLAPQYAWKNIAWFWENVHVNPDASTTDWLPESKKIWFTEFGFPSVDGATNQPNVFYDPLSTDSAFPYFSRGRVDYRAQRAGITATLARWAGSDMVERMFLWTWDARPYPYFPDLLSVWADGINWKTGHWVEGKFGVSNLGAILAELSERGGLQAGDIDVSAVTDPVLGMAVTEQQTIRSVIERLSLAFFFDAAESGGVLNYVPRGGASVATLTQDELIPESREGEAETLLAINRLQEIDLPQRVNVIYLNPLTAYQPATQYAERQVTESKQVDTLTLPIVFDDQTAKTIAERSLFTGWVARNALAFRAGMKFAHLDPADVITLNMDGASHSVRLTAVTLGTPGVVEMEAVAEDISTYDFYSAPGSGTGVALAIEPVAATTCRLLDIPALPGDNPALGVLRAAAAGTSAHWQGGVLYRSDDAGANYNPVVNLQTAAVIGSAVDVLGIGPTTVFDETSSVTVVLMSGNLSSASELAVLNGANAALLGDEIIQFTTATLIAPGKYKLSGLLRGRQGTEWKMDTHAAGERFVLLNALLASQPMSLSLLGLTRSYKAVSVGATVGATVSQDFMYNGMALKPYAPVHITGTRDGSDNLTINWVRRARVSGEWIGGVDVPLNEAREAYEVDILDGVDVVRTISGLTAPTATYSAADQTTDFGAPQGSINVRVYQLSEVVGRGYAGDGNV